MERSELLLSVSARFMQFPIVRERGEKYHSLVFLLAKQSLNCSCLVAATSRRFSNSTNTWLKNTKFSNTHHRYNFLSLIRCAFSSCVPAGRSLCATETTTCGLLPLSVLWVTVMVPLQLSALAVSHGAAHFSPKSRSSDTSDIAVSRTGLEPECVWRICCSL